MRIILTSIFLLFVVTSYSISGTFWMDRLDRAEKMAPVEEKNEHNIFSDDANDQSTIDKENENAVMVRAEFAIATSSPHYEEKSPFSPYKSAKTDLKGYNSREEVLGYIELYKFIAVQEMQENGIPASIKMAQAILESNAGTSDLAIEANNHFGIKCGGIWDGDTYYKKDDDRDRRGQLIKSCFRVFRDGEDSFRAHSQFLRDPRKAYRYGSLFALEKTDYKSWAWGLSKAGYATNPAYANLLIHLIEKYSLYTFDYYEDSNVKFVRPSDLVAQARDVNFSKKLDRKTQNTVISRPGEPISQSGSERLIEINNRDVVKVRQGQTMAQLAQKYDLTPKEIIKYNDNKIELDEFLKEGMYVYLEKKRLWYRGSDKSHTVRKGEDLYRISQLYGIQVSTLERKNKISADMVPLPGEKIIIRGRSVRGDEIPLTYNDVDIVESSEVSVPILADQWELDKATTLKDEEAVQTEEVKTTQTNAVFDLSKEVIPSSQPSPDNLKPNLEPAIQVETHQVVKGDTLYGISRKYNVTIDSIRQYNQLQQNNIQIGQQLKIVK